MAAGYVMATAGMRACVVHRMVLVGYLNSVGNKFVRSPTGYNVIPAETTNQERAGGKFWYINNEARDVDRGGARLLDAADGEVCDNPDSATGVPDLVQLRGGCAS